MGIARERSHQVVDQLDGVGHRVDDAIREIITSQSRWVFDLARSSFQRCPHGQSLGQALAFGRWQPLRGVRVEAGWLVVEPRHAPAIRAEITEQI